MMRAKDIRDECVSLGRDAVKMAKRESNIPTDIYKDSVSALVDAAETALDLERKSREYDVR